MTQDPDPASLSERLRVARRDRRSVRILHDKGIEDRTEGPPPACSVPWLSASFCAWITSSMISASACLCRSSGTSFE